MAKAMNEVTVDRAHLMKAISLASVALEKHSVVPILREMRVHANGSLALEATDLDLSARVELPVMGAAPDMLLPEPTRLRAALRHLGGKTVHLSHSGTAVAVKSGDFAAELTNSGAKPLDHPGVQAVHFEEFRAEIGGEVLGQIARILPAISTEETRYCLNGICLDRLDDWTWRVVATDGHRLMMVDVALPGATGELPSRTIVPKQMVHALMASFGKAKGPVALRYGQTALRNSDGPELSLEPAGARFDASGEVQGVQLTLATKLIDGTYPDYTRVIPTSATHSWTFERKALLRAIHGIAALSDGNKIRAVSLRREGDQVRLSASSAVLGTASVNVPVEMHGAEPEDFYVGFNGRYLIDMLGVLRGEQVEFAMGNGSCAARKGACSDPAVVTDPADTAFRGVLMPMRV